VQSEVIATNKATTSRGPACGHSTRSVPETVRTHPSAFPPPPPLPLELNPVSESDLNEYVGHLRALLTRIGSLQCLLRNESRLVPFSEDAKHIFSAYQNARSGLDQLCSIQSPIDRHDKHGKRKGVPMRTVPPPPPLPPPPPPPPAILIQPQLLPSRCAPRPLGLSKFEFQERDEDGHKERGFFLEESVEQPSIYPPRRMSAGRTEPTGST
jgi:hypothetical protein